MKKLIVGILFLGICINTIMAQVAERPRPKEWDDIVYGARFLDRFLPMSKGTYGRNVWGGDNVLHRYVDNGIEDSVRSYWGGNIIQDKSKLFHLFVCGWREDSPKGHHEWPNSIVYRATSNSLNGPYTLQDSIGKGHNPEAFIARDGKHVIYVIGGRYVSDRIDGPWTYGKFEFDKRDHNIIEGLSNLTFAKREDGSYLMVCRGGGVWFSKTGLSTYNQVTDKRIYPAVDGEFEDPVIWRDHVQYHLVVNDWLGRIAYYLRSKDGVNWITDPGEAYTPSVARHTYGYLEDWFKLERIKVFQDKYGRAIQANFAAIDNFKDHDLPNDKHSSKNIMIPLNPGALISIVDEKMPTTQTKTIRVKVEAEEGFNPHTDIDVESLRFGANSEVNFGKGCKAKEVIKSGSDLIIVFDAKGHGITKDEFAPKLLGKTMQGKLIYGYAKAPWLDYQAPILSARQPKLDIHSSGVKINIDVENFGQRASSTAKLRVLAYHDGKEVIREMMDVKGIEPFEKTIVKLSSKTSLKKNESYEFVVEIDAGFDNISTSSFTVKAE